MALCELRYFSNALGKQTAANVILPEVGSGPYPVMYLLHGLSDDYTIWLRRTSIERYVVNTPLIVVMPDGGRGFYTDAREGFAYGTALGVELVDRIDRTFPTKATRDGRCLTGLSMGGYGAVKLVLAHPDRFASAVSHSGALAWSHRETNRDGTPIGPEWRRILGENFVGGPNDLFALVENVTAEQRPALRIDCGTEDFLIEDNRDFHAHLEKAGIPHDYEEFPGAHNWDYWDVHVQEALAFHKNALGF
jgi:S-formylglutathione hydrolase FrmB